MAANLSRDKLTSINTDNRLVQSRWFSKKRFIYYSFTGKENGPSMSQNFWIFIKQVIVRFREGIKFGIFWSI